MAAAAGEGDNGEKSGFRCLDAARYVAATVVVVLIAAVVVNAIKVVARPDNISVLVLGSSVTTSTQTTTTPAGKDGLLSFEFTLRAENPSGRVRLYFYDIMTYIFENGTVASTPTPADNCSILFPAPNITVKPMGYVNSFKKVSVGDNPDKISHSFFQALNKPGGRVSGATMRVDGSLVSETGFGFKTFNTSAQRIVLYCRELMVGPKDKVATQDTTCTTS